MNKIISNPVPVRFYCECGYEEYSTVHEDTPPFLIPDIFKRKCPKCGKVLRRQKAGVFWVLEKAIDFISRKKKKPKK